MNTIRIRSLSNGIRAILGICLCGYILVPLCIIGASKEGFSFDHMTQEACMIAIMILILAFMPALALLVYIFYHHMKQAVVNPSGVLFKRPMQNNIMIPMERLTAFGIVHFAPRDTKLYFCDAAPETILAFFENHLEECARIFRNLPYRECCKTSEGQWQMAVGIYVYFKQEGVYILKNGDETNLNMIEDLVQKKPININSCRQFP